MIEILLDFWKFAVELIWGKPPPAKVNLTRDDSIPEASAPRGKLILGDQGTGKTVHAMMNMVNGWIKNPHPIVLFDWSGGATNRVLDLLSREKNFPELIKNVVLDELGNEEWVVTKPEFHPSYGLTDEEQVARVVGNMEKMAEYLLAGAPFLAGVSIEEIGKNLFRLLQVIRNEQGESWQITEATRLLVSENYLERACKMYGQYAMPAKDYFEGQYLGKTMPAHEKELTTRALRYILGKIDSSLVKANLGYYKPSYTEKEIDEGNKLLIVDAHKMINLPPAQHYQIMQRFSQVMYWINKREVDNPSNKLFEIVFDETYTILQIKGMAQWLGMVSPLYRSRRIGLTVILQALWQLDETLAKQIWSLGSVISFRIGNIDEAETIAKQLFDYDPKSVKNAPKTESQNPTTEPATGQDRIYADWLQNLKPRQFIMRRYLNEQDKEKGVQFVEKTTPYPETIPFASVPEIKKYLLERDGVRFRDALEVVNQRKLPPIEPEGRRTFTKASSKEI